MKSVYILAPYPAIENLKDGMVQRIAIVDDLLKDHRRIYINIALANKKFKRVFHSDTTEELFLNPKFPLIIINTFLSKAGIIYAHSIHLLKHIPYCFAWIKKRKINFILDAHGIVPEEIKMYGKPALAAYFTWIEKQIFKTLHHCICVSNEMINHYKNKYPSSTVQYHLLFTGKLMPAAKPADVNNLASILEVTTTDCVIMYCGNTQLWQNIPLMIEAIKKIDKPGVKFIVLTGETSQFDSMLKSAGMDKGNIILRSVSPAELNNYYELAHYGLILRDDIAVNRVSNPTKMLEYLQFGLTPIVLSPLIGDYYSMEYEYVSVTGIKQLDLTPKKSEKNIQIAQSIAAGNTAFDINKLIE